MQTRTFLRTLAPAVALTLAAAACGSDGSTAKQSDTKSNTTSSKPDSATVASQTGASELRSTLTSLLTQHVDLAALATSAALRGDNAAFDQFAAALNGPTDSNTSAIVDAIGSIYGEDVGTAFDGLWRSEKHIPQFVAYAQAAANGDQAGKDAAVAELTAYATTFGETLNSVNENLPADAVTEDLTMHATTVLAMIDAQAAGDQTAAFAARNDAVMHMVGTAKVLATATVAKFPNKFDGDAASPAAELRAALTATLEDHVWLAATATGAALGGRTDEFNAAAAALNGPTDSNTSVLVDAITSVYGEEVGTAFDGLWRSEKHIPQFVAYTEAIAKDDQAAADAALEALTAYATTFGETLNSVNPNLPVDAVTEDIVMHATTLKAVIDAQKANGADVATLMLEAAHHMDGTADVLAAATVKQFPGKF